MNGSVKLPEAPTRGLLSYVEGVLFRHRRLVLASLAVFTLIMGWFAVQLRMDAGFETRFVRLPQNVRAAGADVRCREQTSVETGAQVVVALQRIGAGCAAAAIRTEREEKGRLRARIPEYFNQGWDASLSSAAGININLESDLFHV